MRGVCGVFFEIAIAIEIGVGADFDSDSDWVAGVSPLGSEFIVSQPLGLFEA
jgi:hypothetical protein